MDFVAVVDQGIALLRQRGRLTYSTLKRQFQLDDAALEDVKELPHWDRIPFRVHTLDIGDVILGLAWGNGGSALVLRIRPARRVLGLEDIQRLAGGRECEHTGLCWDAGAGAQEAQPEEHSHPFCRHSVSPAAGPPLGARRGAVIAGQ